MAIAIRRLLLPLLAMLLGALALSATFVGYLESRRVERQGIEAPVVSVESNKKVKRSGNFVTFRADIGYTNREGKNVTASGLISDASLKDFREGRAIRVRYLPNEPDVIRVVGDEDEGTSYLLIILGCLGLSYGAVGTFLAVRR